MTIKYIWFSLFVFSLCHFAAFAEPSGASRYSSHYIGINTDVDFNANPEKPIKNFLSFQYLGIGASYGYGRSWFRPRARVNLAWMPGNGFSPTIGFEIPFFETLSEAQSKMFGVYISADAGLAISNAVQPFVRISPYLRIPLGSIEGMSVGSTWNSITGWSIFIGRNTGVYPLRSR